MMLICDSYFKYDNYIICLVWFNVKILTIFSIFIYINYIKAANLHSK